MGFAQKRTVGFGLLCWAVFSGCGDTEVQKKPGQIVVEPIPLTFGANNVNEETRQTLTVRNVGEGLLPIKKIQLNGSSAYRLITWGGVDFGAVVFPNDLAAPFFNSISEKALVVAFVPDSLAEFSGEILVQSADPDVAEREIRVPLTGKGSVPDIDLSPPRLDFGEVALNSSSSLILKVMNKGEARLKVPQGGIALKSGAADSPFSASAIGFEVAANEAHSLEVKYSPRTFQVDPNTHKIKLDSDSLLIASNDPDENPIEVPLTAQATTNLPPLTTVRVQEVRKLDGTLVAFRRPDGQIEGKLCEIAPTDTLTLEGLVLDPEGGALDTAYMEATAPSPWSLPKRPVGNNRDKLTIANRDWRHPTYMVDSTGEYVVCLQAKDALGALTPIDPSKRCECEEANTDLAYGCSCMRFRAFPPCDIRVELIWDTLGPDLDLHLLKPGGTFCSRTLDCRFNPADPNDPGWKRTACVQDSKGNQTCRDPKTCNPVSAGCLTGQQCWDDDGTAPPVCTWKTCSGSDCFWDARSPDWGNPNETRDDPLLAIDCARGCREEDICLSNPEPGDYTALVHYFLRDPNNFPGQTEAQVSVYFKGEIQPAVVVKSRMTQYNDTWEAAIIRWQDAANHSVNPQPTLHAQRTCE